MSLEINNRVLVFQKTSAISSDMHQSFCCVTRVVGGAETIPLHDPLVWYDRLRIEKSSSSSFNLLAQIHCLGEAKQLRTATFVEGGK